MRFNVKQWVAVGLVAIGAVAIYKARDYAQQIFDAKRNIERVSSPFSKNPLGGAVKRKMMREASQYDDDVQMLFYGGVVALGLGVVLFVLGSRKKKS